MGYSVSYKDVPKDTVENMRFRMFVWKWAAQSKEHRDWLMELCRRDILFWVNTFAWTHDPRGSGPSELPFNTWDFQDDAILRVQSAIENESDLAIPKSREQGATWIVEVTFDHSFLFEPHKAFMVASRNMDLVDSPNDPDCLFAKLDFIHHRLPSWMASAKTNLVRTAANIYNSHTGSVITGASKTSDIGRGGRRTAILLDEFAAFRPKESFAVLSATFSTARCRIMNSTPKGVGNAFDDQVNGAKGCQVLRLHWSSHPFQKRGMYRSDENQQLELVDKAFWDTATVRWLRRHCDRVAFSLGPSIPDDALARDYYPFRLDGKVRSPYRDNEGYRLGTESLIAQELEIDFLASGTPFFDGETVQGWIKTMAMEPSVVGEIKLDEKNDPIVEGFNPLPNGRFKLWNHTGSPPKDEQFVIGCDVSAGTGSSNSCMSVTNVTTGEKVASFADPNVNITRFADYVSAMGHRYNDAMIIWEAQGPGVIFGHRLKELCYPRFYYHMRKEDNKRSKAPGWYSTGDGKQELLHRYRQMLTDKTFINRDAKSLSECTEYRWDAGKIVHQSDIIGIDPSDAKTQHGDMVIADALCALGIKFLEREVKAAPPEPPPGSFGYRQRKRHAVQKRESSGRWQSMRLRQKRARWQHAA